MHSPLLVLLLLHGWTAPALLEPGTQLEYQGQFTADREDASDGEKVFRLVLLVAESDHQGCSVYWTLKEEQSGGWSWLNQFGRANVPRSRQDLESSQPSLLYERAAGSSVVPLPFPVLKPKKQLGAGVRWVEGRLVHQVEEAVQMGGREAWKLSVGNAYGRKRTLWIDQASDVVLAAEENVFIGQGEKYVLRFSLSGRSVLPDSKLAGARNAFESLLAVRKQLGISPHTKNVNWSQANLQLLADRLPQILPQANTPQSLQAVVNAAVRETKRQQNTLGAVISVKKRLVGKPAPQAELTDLAGDVFDWKQLQGKVTVLHFWEYRDSPLVEPYGQIAYVDFLHRSHDADQVRVLGISVDERLSEPSTYKQAVRSVKKLRSFMNLSYTQLLDTGSAIQRYGDPRVTGAKLPLFVVLDREGTIVHYHVGNYPIDRDRGLKTLDEEVRRALGSPE